MSNYGRDGLAVRIMKIVVKAIGLTLVFGTSIFFIWRAFFSTVIPDEVNGLVINDGLHAAWEEATEAGEELTYFTQAQSETTSAEHNYSYFTVKNVVFVEDAQQIQLLFRYNNATIRHLVEDYDLPEVPDRGTDLYDVTLYVAYDLTPDDLTDNAGNDPASVKFVRYTASACDTAKTLIYNYRRYVFEGVDMTVTENPVLAVYVDIYYKEDIDYEKDPYGTLCIYDYLSEKEYREVDKHTVEALREYP